MAPKISKWKRFKKFLKRNMTPTWAKHFLYQVVSFVISVIMVLGVANYTITKSYSERTLTFMDDFTVTVRTGAFDTQEDSLESIQAAIQNNAEVIGIDIRQRPNGTLVISNDIIVTNGEGVLLSDVFKLLKEDDCFINIDIKEARTLNTLYDMLVEYNLLERSFLTGIDQLNIKALKESSCSGMDYYLNYQPSRLKIFSGDYQRKILNLLEETGAIGINCNYKYAGAKLSDVLHANGYKLSVWTVNSEFAMKRMLMAHPDNITTKQYDRLISVIDNWGE
ncbi:MAG: glycerophosphodiester phosphodiesterase [Clostridiales bacterium]|nr:glycerophosphodiester phosphodiesterase [Clostridiales bacterium]